ncbi:MAG: sigma-E factor negative regulatory protein [Pseudomonadota bacterium]
MSEQNLQQSLSESISALVDNQASELELQRVLKASEKDPDVKATWARYQIMGAILRGEQASQSAIVLSDFAARVSASIAAEEQIIVIPAQKANQSWWHQLGRVALVASVAGGMIISVQQYNNIAIQSEVASTAGSAAIPAPMISPLSLPSGINGPAFNTRSVALQTGYETRPQENRRVMFQPRQAVVPNAPATTISEEELTRYVNEMIQAHSDNAALNSSQGVLPYARVIVTDE